MPQLSPIEILVVATIALIVFGPEKLPQIARTIGRSAAELRRMATEVKEEFQAGLDLDDEDEAPKPSRRPHPNEAATPPRVSDEDAARDALGIDGEGADQPPVARGLSPADGDSGRTPERPGEGNEPSGAAPAGASGSESDPADNGPAGPDDGSSNGRGPGGS
jgi:Tat protein translocase TatB subunit